MIKKIIGFSLGAGLILAGAVPAFAQNQCGNQTTGAESINSCIRSLIKEKTLGVTNSGTITHNVTSKAISGGNKANRNTSGGSIGAGSATASVAKQASLNTGEVTLSQSDPLTEDVGLNDTTGYNSTNTVSITTQKKITLNLGNSGTVTQNLTTEATSGDNTANENTVGGEVTTGDAAVDTTVLSVLNDFVINISQ